MSEFKGLPEHLQNRMLWVDVETTGLNPHADDVLEIGLAITDDKMLEIQTCRNWVIHQPLIPDTWDPFVLNMHAKSGLLTECLTEGVPLWKAMQEACDFIRECFFITEAHPEPLVLEHGGVGSSIAMDERPRLCGSSVHFDHAFLTRASVLTTQRIADGDIDSLVHYRHLDVSSVANLFERWRPDVFAARPEDRKTHRVLADIDDSLTQMRFYLMNLHKLNEGLPNA